MAEAIRRTASSSDAGRSCPYCRFPTKQGASISVCPSCEATHHDDCWSENGGCAVVGCAGAPTAAGSSAPDPASTRGPIPPPKLQPPTGSGQALGAAAAGGPGWGAPTTPPAGWTPPAGPPPTPGRNGPSGWLIAAVLALALVVAGSAAALVLTRDRGSSDEAELSDAARSPATEDVATTTETEPATTAETSASRSARSSPASDRPAGVLPDVSTDEMAADIATTIADYHRAIGNGDTETAWGLLSARRHRLETSGGYLDGRVRTRESWAENERETGRKVSATTARAKIVELDRRNGVATVVVTGMRAVGSAAARCGGRWEGLTWAKYEDGSWKYEPGANTTPNRKAQYPNAGQRRDLLGNACQ